MKYNERQEQNGRGFRAELTKENEIKSALRVGGKGTGDLVMVHGGGIAKREVWNRSKEK